MTRTEAFDKAWRLVFKGDFSLFDEIYHPDFKGINPIIGDVELNFDAFKEGVHTLKDFIIFTPSKILAEEDKFLKVRRYNKLKEADVFFFGDSIYHLQRWEIINQQYLVEELDHDPSEGQDWN